MTTTAKQAEQQEQWVLVRTHANSPMLTLSLPGVDLDNVLLVRIEPGISSALHTDCRLAMSDPANVYRVSALPGLVEAMEREVERCHGCEGSGTVYGPDEHTGLGWVGTRCPECDESREVLLLSRPTARKPQNG